MFKRYNPNYSLWPERARPGRRLPLTLAAGSFAIGFVCAAAAYTVFSAFVGPAAVQESPAQREVQDSPVITPETPPAPAPKAVPPPPPENTNHASRTPARAARMPLPIIGSQAARPNAATDGRGDADLAGAASTPGLAASSDSAPSQIREEGDPALQPRAHDASTDVDAPGPASEPAAPPRKKSVRKTRERAKAYAERSRQQRERSATYAAAARGRQGPAYPTVSETASWY